VSIVIPTRNGMRTLPGVLEAVAGQRIDLPFEIVAVDSESSDGTPDWLAGRVQRLLTIRASEFDHGLTRNLGVEQARGALIVLLVQDAQPRSDRWLANLVAPLLADESLAGTFARQQPYPDANPIVRYYLERAVVGSSEPRVARLRDLADFQAMAPLERLSVCTFDNVCSCIRRSVWRAHPFRAAVIAEDLAWARDVLLAGHGLAFVPAATVVHSHDRPASYEFERTRQLHRRLNELFDVRTIPTLPALARAVSSSLALHVRCHPRAARNIRGVAGLGRSLALAAAWPLGQYLGARAAVADRSRARDGGV
jgi:rhamnosyltransferase